MWESHADPGVERIVKPMPERALPIYTMDEPACTPVDRVVAAVTAPPVDPGDLKALLRCLHPTAPVPTPPSRPMPTDMGFLLECSLCGMSARRQNRRLRLGSREWKPCYSACSRERRIRPRSCDRVPLAETGLP